MLTPQPQAKQLAKTLGLNTELYLKREDLHLHGSHKGRSVPVMIEKYIQLGKTDFCISSSGNAAISAAIFVNEYNAKQKNSKLSLKIFIGNNISEEKFKIIKKLLNKSVLSQRTSNPKQSAFQMDKEGLAQNLRQSTDDTALLGYAGLAKELAAIKNLNAIFIPTSSGTTAQALYEEFKKLKLSPQIHIIQTDACHPIAEAFHLLSIKTSATPSIAGAIVDNVARRKEKVVTALKTSKGNAWVCGNKEIKNAVALTKKTEKITISPNSALAVAGLIQAIKNNWKFNGPAVCILTGR
jgi:threonine synthase